MAVVEEKLAEAVRKYIVLYDKADKILKIETKNDWHGRIKEDVTSIPASFVKDAGIDNHGQKLMAKRQNLRENSIS